MQGGSAAAMAALSALLRSLQAEGTASSSAVVSPQASQGAEASASSAGALPRGPSAEKRSDPLEQAEEGLAEEGQAEEGQPAAEEGEESLDVEALLPEGAAPAGSDGGGQGTSPRAEPEPATPLAPLASTPQLGGTTIPAEWHRQGGSAASARGHSRIPLPPPVGSAPAKTSPLAAASGVKPEPLISTQSSPTTGSASTAAAAKLRRSPRVGGASPGRGIKALFGCGHPSPQATLSSSRL